MKHNPFLSELIQTADGSHTLKLLDFDEQYHSVNGALQESKHVFLSSGLHAFDKIPDPLFVLEVGLGTGLNALLTARDALMKQTRILYEAIEPFPLRNEIIEKLNYPSIFTEPWIGELFGRIHSAGSENYENFLDWFFFRCHCMPIQEKILDDKKYHLVYFDAFGPDTQPEMWTYEIFLKIFAAMKPGGILVTYCAKGAVRRAMQEAGFKVEKLPGPAGKREITRARKPQDN
ncbi:MAG: tRNA (5-methylaminomethyl-2-thiouridine)(34)-methyltransferase MnmD [Bacteroidota bacterium]